MKKFLEDIKKATVFLGTIQVTKQLTIPNFLATGFLIETDNIFHLVTAKHVVFKEEEGEEDLFVFLNNKQRNIIYRKISDIKQKLKVNWIINKDVDIAIIPFEVEPGIDDIKIIPASSFLSIESIGELYDVFFASFQPEIKLNKIEPIFRKGVISIINEDGSFYIDGFVYPGNSGSPVFLMPSPIRFDDSEKINIGGDMLGGKFIGVIGEYLPYQETAISVKTKRARVIFEENTGLSRVWSVNCLTNIIMSEEFKRQIDGLKQRMGLSSERCK